MGPLLIWTIKEALSKVIKTGLTVDFKIFEIESLKVKSGGYVSLFKNFPQYKSISFFARNYAFSIVLPEKTDVDALELANLLQDLSEKTLLK